MQVAGDLHIQGGEIACGPRGEHDLIPQGRGGAPVGDGLTGDLAHHLELGALAQVGQHRGLGVGLGPDVDAVAGEHPVVAAGGAVGGLRVVAGAHLIAHADALQVTCHGAGGGVAVVFQGAVVLQGVALAVQGDAVRPDGVAVGSGAHVVLVVGVVVHSPVKLIPAVCGYWRPQSNRCHSVQPRL